MLQPDDFAATLPVAYARRAAPHICRCICPDPYWHDCDGITRCLPRAIQGAGRTRLRTRHAHNAHVWFVRWFWFRHSWSSVGSFNSIRDNRSDARRTPPAQTRIQLDGLPGFYRLPPPWCTMMFLDSSPFAVMISTAPTRTFPAPRRMPTFTPPAHLLPLLPLRTWMCPYPAAGPYRRVIRPFAPTPPRNTTAAYTLASTTADAYACRSIFQQHQRCGSDRRHTGAATTARLRLPTHATCRLPRLTPFATLRVHTSSCLYPRFVGSLVGLYCI